MVFMRNDKENCLGDKMCRRGGKKKEEKERGSPTLYHLPRHHNTAAEFLFLFASSCAVVAVGWVGAGGLVVFSLLR